MNTQNKVEIIEFEGRQIEVVGSPEADTLLGNVYYTRGFVEDLARFICETGTVFESTDGSEWIDLGVWLNDLEKHHAETGSTNYSERIDGRVYEYSYNVSVMCIDEEAEEYVAIYGYFKPYMVEDRESGNYQIQDFYTIEEAEDYITKLEEEDRAEGNYSPNYYAIRNLVTGDIEVI